VDVIWQRLYQTNSEPTSHSDMADAATLESLLLQRSDESTLDHRFLAVDLAPSCIPVVKVLR
jgi:hypothetical protein